MMKRNDSSLTLEASATVWCGITSKAGEYF